MIRVELSNRAHSDLQKIEAYSIQNFGKKTADKYLDDIEAALTLLQERPELLNSKTNISDCFVFYRVRQHYIVCTQVDNTIYALTIKHVQMDIPARIAELEPLLLQETEILHTKLKRRPNTLLTKKGA